MKLDYNNLVPGSVDVFALSAALPLPAYSPPEGQLWPVLPPSGAEESDIWAPLEPGVVFPPQVGADALADEAGAAIEPSWGLDGLMTDARLLTLGLGGPGADGLAADLAAFGPATLHLPMTGTDALAPSAGADAAPVYVSDGFPVEVDAVEAASTLESDGLEVFTGAFDDGAGEIGFEDPWVYDSAGDAQLLTFDAFEHPDFVAAD